MVQSPNYSHSTFVVVRREKIEENCPVVLIRIKKTWLIGTEKKITNIWF